MAELNKVVTASEAIDTIEQIFGKYPGCRRGHTKGIACNAVFWPSGAASPYTIAGHLQNEPAKAIVRFSQSWPKAYWFHTLLRLLNYTLFITDSETDGHSSCKNIQKQLNSIKQCRI